MNVRFLTLAQFVATLNTEPGDRNCVIAGGVALAIARHLPLPSAPVDAPGSHYNFTNLQAAKDLIGEFNEQVVFGVKEALEETREFWMLRYTAAHSPRFNVIKPELGFYDNLLGCGKWVDQESHCFNNKYKMEIFALADVCGAILDAAV